MKSHKCVEIAVAWKLTFRRITIRAQKTTFYSVPKSCGPLQTHKNNEQNHQSGIVGEADMSTYSYSFLFVLL